MGANWLRELKTDPGLQAWRIDGKSEEISTVPKGNLGVFRSDDCYILLRISMPSEGDKPEFLILFWIGKSTKIEVNSRKKLEDLENKLKSFDFPFETVIETQHNESESFKELFLFRGGAMYIEPITLKRQNNLREDEFHKALYQIKGKKFARVKRVALGHESLNSGDVFVLDNDQIIYQWNGKKANRMEKGRAMDLTKRLRDERMNRCKAEIILEEEGRESEDFWTCLGGKGTIKSAEEGGSDDDFELASVTEDVLHRVGLDASRQVNIERIDRTDFLHRGMLEHESSYVLDCQTEIFVWHGSKTTGTIRQEAAVFADGLQKDGTRPDWVDVTITANGAEPGLFKVKWKGLFEEYVDTPLKYQKRLNNMNPVAKVRQERINVDALLNPEKYAAAKEEEIGNERLISNKNPEDDAEMKIYYIKRKQLVELPQDEYGFFYSENCYVLHYAIRIPGSSTRHIIYFWQGRGSSINSRGYSAMLASDLAKNTARDAIQVRVVQNKEPEHFLSHFEGFYCVRTGKRHGWKKRQEHPVLYQIRGQNSIFARAIQVRSHASSLSSSDVYLIHKRKELIQVWIGQGANEFERKFAETWSNKLAQSDAEEVIPIKTVEEGSETDEFWGLLPGGKADYCHLKQLQKKPRLFICSDRTSVFKVTECIGFAQEDLNERTVCFLDCEHEVFLWIGAEATVRERKMATQTALDYITEAGRDPNSCHLYMTYSGMESFHFTVYFQGWEHEITVDELLEALADESEVTEQKAKKTGAAPVRITTAEAALKRSLSRKNSKIQRQQSINAGRRAGISRVGSIRDGKRNAISRQVSTRNRGHGALSPRNEGLDTHVSDTAEILEGAPVDGIRGTRTKTLDRSPSMMLVQVEFTKRTRNVNKWNPEGLIVDFDRLKVKPIPEGVDGAHLEAYLCIEEFAEIFEMPIEKFYSLPIWKQLVVKKDKGLF